MLGLHITKRTYIGTCSATQHTALLTSGKGTYCLWHRIAKRFR